MSVTGAIVVVAVLAAATLVGLVLKARAGRVRATTDERTGGWDLAGVTPQPDDRVLLLQLSSPICTPCRQTAAQLTGLSAEHPGLAHVEVDIAERPDTARELNVMRTPTTIAFARDGRELLRVSGVPRRRDLLAALDTELTAPR
ncbi:thioredoxin family protein [Actinomycetospora atypica]|uniref:Thioredoxin family protein n=1 Tax=Actinomycetospora atypica TaxID=1290095 RepID=A0ABV9YRG9_9PSEU